MASLRLSPLQVLPSPSGKSPSFSDPQGSLSLITVGGLEPGGVVRSEVCGVRDEVCGVRSEVCGVRSEVCEVRSEVCEVRSEVC